jgi:manganese oxidase
MPFTRRSLLFSSVAGAMTGLLGGVRSASAAVLRAAGHHGPPPKPAPARRRSGRRLPVITPNGTTLPYRMVGGVKEYHLIAEPVRREFVNGLEVN